MARVRNISNGPRGAYVKVQGSKTASLEVWAAPGEVIEADDYNKAHFAPEDSDEAKAAARATVHAVSLEDLVKQAVAVGIFESEDEFREDLTEAISAKREDEAEGGEQEKPEPVTDQLILEAVTNLDPKDDTHWTAKGEPAVEAVEKLLDARITRADITRAAPSAARPVSQPAA